MGAMTSRRLVAYEIMMEQTPTSKYELKEDAFCKGCRFHRHKWKYRFCLFTECPYMKGMKTFREEAFDGGT